jgi:ketosteroid isomerase-like protein
MRAGPAGRTLGWSTEQRSETMSTITTTEHPNAATVRRMYEAINRGDIPELTALISSDVTMTMPGGSPLAGRYDGRDALFGFFGKLGEATGGTYHADLRDVYTSDGRVLAVHRGTGTNGDRKLDAEAALLIELSDGVISTVTVFQQRQDEWDGFFS